MNRRKKFLLMLNYSLAIHGWLLSVSPERESVIFSPCGQGVCFPVSFAELFERQCWFGPAQRSGSGQTFKGSRTWKAVPLEWLPGSPLRWLPFCQRSQWCELCEPMGFGAVSNRSKERASASASPTPIGPEKNLGGLIKMQIQTHRVWGGAWHSLCLASS